MKIKLNQALQEIIILALLLSATSCATTVDLEAEHTNQFEETEAQDTKEERTESGRSNRSGRIRSA